MPTYRQKMENLRLKSLSIIEKGLDNPDPSMLFCNAVQFLAWNMNTDIDKEMLAEPDALDAEEITEKEKE